MTIPELTLGAGQRTRSACISMAWWMAEPVTTFCGRAFFIDGTGLYPAWQMHGGGLLYGNDGNDYLSGSTGFGYQDGDNVLIGGRGRDVLAGGGGADTFMLLEEDASTTSWMWVGRRLSHRLAPQRRRSICRSGLVRHRRQRLCRAGALVRQRHRAGYGGLRRRRWRGEYLCLYVRLTHRESGAAVRPCAADHGSPRHRRADHPGQGRRLGGNRHRIRGLRRRHAPEHRRGSGAVGPGSGCPWFQTARRDLHRSGRRQDRWRSQPRCAGWRCWQ
ncbi:MAG: calcium-binding protein [Sulfuritalea sp.]|nr:calcium-binding protein [Sulfuritalea sp.]